MLPKLGIDARFAEDDNPVNLEKLIDNKTSAVFCESIGNPGRKYPGSASDRRYGPYARRTRDRRQHRAYAGADASN